MNLNKFNKIFLVYSSTAWYYRRDVDQKEMIAGTGTEIALGIAAASFFVFLKNKKDIADSPTLGERQKK